MPRQTPDDQFAQLNPLVAPLFDDGGPLQHIKINDAKAFNQLLIANPNKDALIAAFKNSTAYGLPVDSAAVAKTVKGVVGGSVIGGGGASLVTYAASFIFGPLGYTLPAIAASAVAVYGGKSFYDKSGDDAKEVFAKAMFVHQQFLKVAESAIDSPVLLALLRDDKTVKDRVTSKIEDKNAPAEVKNLIDRLDANISKVDFDTALVALGVREGTGAGDLLNNLWKENQFKQVLHRARRASPPPRPELIRFLTEKRGVIEAKLGGGPADRSAISVNLGNLWAAAPGTGVPPTAYKADIGTELTALGIPVGDQPALIDSIYAENQFIRVTAELVAGVPTYPELKRVLENNAQAVKDTLKTRSSDEIKTILDGLKKASPTTVAAQLAYLGITDATVQRAVLKEVQYNILAHGLAADGPLGDASEKLRASSPSLLILITTHSAAIKTELETKSLEDFLNAVKNVRSQADLTAALTQIGLGRFTNAASLGAIFGEIQYSRLVTEAKAKGDAKFEAFLIDVANAPRIKGVLAAKQTKADVDALITAVVNAKTKATGGRVGLEDALQELVGGAPTYPATASLDDLWGEASLRRLMDQAAPRQIPLAFPPSVAGPLRTLFATGAMATQVEIDAFLAPTTQAGRTFITRVEALGAFPNTGGLHPEAKALSVALATRTYYPELLAYVRSKEPEIKAGIAAPKTFETFQADLKKIANKAEVAAAFATIRDLGTSEATVDKIFGEIQFNRLVAEAQQRGDVELAIFLRRNADTTIVKLSTLSTKAEVDDLVKAVHNAEVRAHAPPAPSLQSALVALSGVRDIAGLHYGATTPEKLYGESNFRRIYDAGTPELQRALLAENDPPNGHTVRSVLQADFSGRANKSEVDAQLELRDFEARVGILGGNFPGGVHGAQVKALKRAYASRVGATLESSDTTRATRQHYSTIAAQIKDLNDKIASWGWGWDNSVTAGGKIDRQREALELIQQARVVQDLLNIDHPLYKPLDDLIKGLETNAAYAGAVTQIANPAAVSAAIARFTAPGGDGTYQTALTAAQAVGGGAPNIERITALLSAPFNHLRTSGGKDQLARIKALTSDYGKESEFTPQRRVADPRTWFKEGRSKHGARDAKPLVDLAELYSQQTQDISTPAQLIELKTRGESLLAQMTNIAGQIEASKMTEANKAVQIGLVNDARKVVMKGLAEIKAQEIIEEKDREVTFITLGGAKAKSEPIMIDSEAKLRSTALAILGADAHDPAAAVEPIVMGAAEDVESKLQKTKKTTGALDPSGAAKFVYSEKQSIKYTERDPVTGAVVRDPAGAPVEQSADFVTAKGVNPATKNWGVYIWCKDSDIRKLDGFDKLVMAASIVENFRREKPGVKMTLTGKMPRELAAYIMLYSKMMQENDPTYQTPICRVSLPSWTRDPKQWNEHLKEMRMNKDTNREQFVAQMYASMGHLGKSPTEITQATDAGLSGMQFK